MVNHYLMIEEYDILCLRKDLNMRLTEKEAKEIGRKKCIELLGKEFCVQHQDNSTIAWGLNEDDSFGVYVGISNEPITDTSRIVLSNRPWKYEANVFVDMFTGNVSVYYVNPPKK